MGPPTSSFPAFSTSGDGKKEVEGKEKIYRNQALYNFLFYLFTSMVLVLVKDFNSI